MLKVTARTKIALMAKQIDLPKWFYSFSEAEFQKSSRSNLEMSVSKNKAGKRVFTNKVQEAGHLLINNYIEEVSKPNYLKMVSPNSRLLLFHIWPISIIVTYELLIEDTSPDSVDLVCTSTGEYPFWLEIISRLTFAKFFLQKHQNEETKYFAEDIFKKFKSV